MGGLNLRGNLPLGVGAARSQSIREKWDTVDESDARVINSGLVDHPKPEFVCPDLTADALTTTDSWSYTETYVHLLGWSTYANELRAQVQARILQFENMKDIVTAQTRTLQRELAKASGKKPSSEELEDILLTNPEYLEVLLELQKLKQSKMLLDAKVESIDRSLRVISRQVEIRKLDVEQGRTGAAMPSRNLRDPSPAREPPTLGRR